MGLNVNAAKADALKDITTDAHKEGTQNYITMEYKVLLMCDVYDELTEILTFNP